MELFTTIKNRKCLVDQSKAMVDVYTQSLKQDQRALNLEWNKVQKILRDLIPSDVNYKLMIEQKNGWREDVIPTVKGVVAYVNVERKTFLWNHQVQPATAVSPTPDEWRTIHDIETKILDLGFKLNHEIVEGGNWVCWQLSLT